MRLLPDDPKEPDGFVHIGKVVGTVTKEIARRYELRKRLEAEQGRSISDEEFLESAEKTAIKISKKK